MVFDEVAKDTYEAIYICGVINKGYHKKEKYPHNVHLPIIPKDGCNDIYEFDGWRVEIENGFVDRIIGLDELPEEYSQLPDEYVTCRIYRWMIGYFSAMWEASFKDRKME